MNKIALSQWTRTRITLIHRRPLSLGCSLSFHQDKGQPKSRFGFSLSSGETQKSHSQFESYYADVKNRFNSVDKDTKYSIAKEAYLTGYVNSQTSSQGISWQSKLFDFGLRLITGLFLFGFLFWIARSLSFSMGSLGGRDIEEHDYMVEDSKKNFGDVKGMPEILQEFQQVVDIIKSKDKYTAMGAELPRGVLLSGPPGTGKTLIAKAIAGEAGVPFLYASGSQFDEMFVGVGAKRVRKLFEEARDNSPCIIFLDEIDAVGGKRTGSGFESSSSRMTINQLLQEMDGFKSDENVIVIGATNLKSVLDPALLRPGRFDLTIDVPMPDMEGRKDILEHYFSKVKRDDTISIERIANITQGFTGAQLSNIVNQAAIKAVRDGHKAIDLSHLEYAFDKITMGPELKSMKQNLEAERKTAIHEGGHCLTAYLLHKQGVYGNKPRKATVTRRGGALGHVSFMSDEKKDESSQSLEHLRSHLIVAMGGRAAEAIFAGEERVCTGASSDMQQAESIARNIVCGASAGNQVKGRYINFEKSSEKKKEEIDSLIDHEVKVAYEKALEMLKSESQAHNLLIEGMMEFKTLDYDEIDLLLTSKSMKKLRKTREEAEQKRKSGANGGGMTKLLGSILSDDDKKGPN